MSRGKKEELNSLYVDGAENSVHSECSDAAQDYVRANEQVDTALAKDTKKVKGINLLEHPTQTTTQRYP